jgi:aspartyl/glutamyl-tRNA(Asn/Gln) amidotransferase C subunit
MTNTIDVAALAKLSRLEVAENELAKLEKEIPAILEFVDVIQKAPVSKEAKSPAHRNVLRDDANPHEGGLYTKRLLDAAPAREGDRFAVKQVISRRKK